MMKRSPRHPAGFTLLELLVTLTILAMVLLVLSTIFIATNRTHRKVNRNANLQASARQALSLLSTEVREAGADPTVPPTGIVGIVSADSVSLRVRADLNADGAITTTEPSEDVTYTYVPGTKTLQRNPGTGASDLLKNVTAMTFTYFDVNNAPLTSLPLSASDRLAVHSIGVSITCLDRDSQTLNLSSRISLRNQ
jgi:type IV pilus assembly protein PilW